MYERYTTNKFTLIPEINVKKAFREKYFNNYFPIIISGI